MDTNGLNATNAGDGRWHEKGSFHHCHQMLWHGSLDGSLLMEQGSMHACIWPYYFSRISFPQQKKLQEMAYVSVGVHPQVNQGHPTTEAADSNKAGDIDGGVKYNGALLDC